MSKLKEQAQTWHAVSVASSVLQTCSFSIWVVLLLVVTSAPFWMWIIGAFYVFSHWFHYITWLIAGSFRSDYEKELKQSRADEGVPDTQ